MMFHYKGLSNIKYDCVIFFFSYRTYVLPEDALCSVSVWMGFTSCGHCISESERVVSIRRMQPDGERTAGWMERERERDGEREGEGWEREREGWERERERVVSIRRMQPDGDRMAGWMERERERELDPLFFQAEERGGWGQHGFK